ncbi:MAG: sensor histidine kinase [Proteobacteria bacterium]|nr:sensor histidine kinase [Pseudomonadota bacterium]
MSPSSLYRSLVLPAGAFLLVVAVTVASVHFAPDRPWLLFIFMALAFVVVAVVGGRGPGLVGVGFGTLALAIALPGEGLAVPDPDDALALIATLALGLLVTWAAGHWKRRNDSLAAELRLARAGHERATALLRELSHRLANDLAMLVSTASLAARRSTSPETAATLDQVISRMVVLSRVYQRLRIDEATSERVELSAFIANLCDDMLLTRFNMRPIALHLELSACAVPLSQAVILGLVTNELLTNIAKHSFPDDRPGNVAVRLRPHPFRPDAMQLTVSDDGIGFTPAPPDDAHMGQRLLAALASQLGGDIAVARREGKTIATLHFPLSPRILDT